MTKKKIDSKKNKTAAETVRKITASIDSKSKKKVYELKSRLIDELDSYNVNDLIYELPTRKTRNADLTITQNTKDTCWKISIGGNVKSNLLSQKLSLNNKLSFSVTRKDDPNILYKTLKFDFTEFQDGKYLIIPFDQDFEISNLRAEVSQGGKR